MTEIRLEQSSLHSAGFRISGLASDVQSARGVGRNASSSASGAAAHPDAQGAITSFWEQTESKLGMVYALTNAVADALHGSADTFGVSDHYAGTEFDALNSRTGAG
jgi:hypothetical protein